MKDNITCGCVTLKKHYTLRYVNNNEFKVFFKDKELCNGNLFPKSAQNIVDCLNDSYQNGYHDCSIELMNK